MEDIEEREVAGLRVRIDRTLCVGFEDCFEDAPGLFELDDEGVCTFGRDLGSVERNAVLCACEACPVDALEAYGADGSKLV
ncbi:MAG TPA: ferredoxin [Longimicrobiales bacterium]|nr:ferredoxin [Longimicrobiales bacterium]